MITPPAVLDSSLLHGREQSADGTGRQGDAGPQSLLFKLTSNASRLCAEEIAMITLGSKTGTMPIR